MFGSESFPLGGQNDPNSHETGFLVLSDLDRLLLNYARSACEPAHPSATYVSIVSKRVSVSNLSTNRKPDNLEASKRSELIVGRRLSWLVLSQNVDEREWI